MVECNAGYQMTELMTRMYSVPFQLSTYVLTCNSCTCRAHLQTGAEIWEQTGGKLDAFVSGAGTGGTIAGVSMALKSKHAGAKVYLIDPPGSSLYNKVWDCPGCWFE